MALTTTTLSSAVAVNDNSIAVASATGFAAGNPILIDQEVLKVAQSYVSGTTIPVLRGQDGSVTAAHKSSANAVMFLASDESGPSPQTVTQWPNVRARRLVSISATGAIPLPNPGEDLDVLLNGTSVIAGTLANPTKDLDGCRLTVIGNGKAAHTLTYTAGLGNGGANLDVNTWAAGAQIAMQLIAANGIWVPFGVMAGTLTNITITAS